MPALDFIEPMLCLPVDTLPKGDWLYEIKWDGYRAQGIVERSRSRLLSRNGTSLAADFPDIARALATLDCWRAIVDGEIVALDETGRPDFQQLQQRKNRTAPVRLVLFDLLHLDGEDLLDEPLEARRTLLQRLVRNAGLPLMYSGELQGSPEDLIHSAAAMQIEGIIAKKRGSPYLPDNRKGAWVKCRTEQRGTFLVGGYLPNGGSFDELYVGAKEGRRLRYVSTVRAGFVPRTKAALFDELRGLETAACPFYNLPEKGPARWGRSLDEEKMKECRWVKPVVQVELAFVEWTEAKHLRHARFRSLKA